MKTARALLCLPVLALNLVAQVILAPGQDSYLSPVAGSGQGYVHIYPTFPAPLDGSIIILSAERNGRGYVLEYFGDTQAMELDWGYPVHGKSPYGLAMDRWYYLVGTDAAGAQALRTEPFLLDGPDVNPDLFVIPEPWFATVAAGLGLAGFALWRRR